MKVSYSWLQEYIEETLLPVEEVARMLTMHSFEVEGLEKKGSDTILDIKILPNRSHDCLSHYGIASEIASVCSLRRKALLSPVLLQKTDALKVSLDTPLCSREVMVLIENIQVSESPDWLREKLTALGQRPINNIVDITNYLMYAFGQPLHAFDANKIVSDKKGRREINIRPAKKSEKIALLNGEEYELSPSVLVIADKEKALDVAGVMGGAVTGVSKDTRNILLSLSHFDPVSIRKTAKALALRSDASYRFENEISPALIDRVLPYALRLISELAGGIVVGGVDAYPKPSSPKKLATTAEKISSILGVSMSGEKIVELLSRQNISAEEKNGVIEAFPPLERLDLDMPEALAEEVGRLYGYENITSTALPSAEKPSVNKLQYIIDTIKVCLANLGFSEVYTYALSDSGEVEIENPLASDKKFLRKDLAQAITASLLHNSKYLDLLGISEVKIFEIGKIFRADGEKMYLAIGINYPKNKKGTSVEMEVAKAVHSIEEALNVSFGDISIVGGLAEINLESILSEIAVPQDYIPLDLPSHAPISYRPISPYPFAVRDVAFFAPPDLEEKSLAEDIKNAAGMYLVRLSLFDVFKKEIEGVQKTSYAYRLVFQSQNKTLVEEEIQGGMEKVYEKLKSLNCEIR